MRTYAFKQIVAHLSLKLGTKVKYYDLWRDQVRNLNREKPFPMPAVFFEFPPFRWRELSQKIQDANVSLRLHIVTHTMARSYEGSRNQDEAMIGLNMCDEVHTALGDFGADFMTRPVRTDTIPDTNFSDITDEIEVYNFRLIDISAMRKETTVKDLQLLIDKSIKQESPE